MLDFFDPNTWALAEPYEFRIYGDDNAQTWGVVDEIDYHFLIRWKWSWTSPQTPRAKKKRPEKLYLKRTFEEQIEPEKFKAGGKWLNPETGRTVRHRKPRVQRSLRLHTVIMLRTGIVPPSPEYEIVDHIDGNEKNYRRSNLRWATHSMNRRNIFGSAMEEMNGIQALP